MELLARTRRLGRAVPAVLSLVACLAASTAEAATTRCPEDFLGGEAPDLTSEAVRQRTTELCYPGFATMNSGLTRTSIWSAERLTRDRVVAARNQDREDSFKADPNVPFADRAELSDYAHSGYDRGHMSPNGDMPDRASQSASFHLSNMVPQDPDNNRHLWSDIESAVRDLAMRDGEVFVVTGPVFSGDTVGSLKGRVLVPTYVFKAVYSSRSDGAGVYLARNAPGKEWKAISVDELRTMTNIDVFPALPAATKRVVMDLPGPHERRERRRQESSVGVGGAFLKYLGIR